MNLPKSADEPGSTVPPRSTSRCLIFGAAMPYHEIASYPGTKSATVGKSGSASVARQRGHREPAQPARVDVVERRRRGLDYELDLPPSRSEERRVGKEC